MSCNPATSVHLCYQLPQAPKLLSRAKEIRFGQTVIVEETDLQSYFCVVQFCPGGYCGIQQRDAIDDKIAIFSVWHDDEAGNEVELVDMEQTVEVMPFYGEGEGLKSIRPFQWNLNEPISFEVIVTRESEAEESELSTYLMECQIGRGDDRYGMARFRRKGAHPAAHGFMCFVEDYNRWDNPNGMETRRSALYGRAWCQIDGERHELESAKFSKIQCGVEAQFGDRCSAEPVADRSAFRLFTGGPQLEAFCKPGTCLCLR